MNIRVWLISATLFITGSVQAAYEHPDDPWESFNRKVFAFNDTLDRWVLKPVAQGYRYVTPGFVDKAITNFFHNFADVPHLANTLLQLKGRESAITFTRIVFNTTWGIGGLIDIATAWDLPVQEEDFGQTLNYYGAPEGNYLIIPIFGPSTVTEAIGRVPDAFFDPVSFLFHSPENYALPITEAIDARADLIPAEGLLTGDKYASLRSLYLQRRDYLIHDGEVQDSFLEDEEDYSDF